ncbi:hypothetical protein SBBP2_1390017 [Burkholderiales bacterium]|nr:hypothetical protein SBBP2_1390017 [Burkholderiales bacterium]
MRFNPNLAQLPGRRRDEAAEKEAGFTGGSARCDRHPLAVKHALYVWQELAKVRTKAGRENDAIELFFREIRSSGSMPLWAPRACL